MILITGVNGFLGFYLTDLLLQKKIPVLATGKGNCRLPYAGRPGFIYSSLDFTDPFAVHDVFEKFRPAAIIHAGAMSKPDECELNQWQCFDTNVQGTLHLLANAEEYRSFFLFVSTDFVFSGNDGIYREDDMHGPVNFYGKTKSEAEDAVKEYPFDWSIVRTSLVYGKPETGRQNILSIVKDKLEKRERYQLVNDQVRTPTHVGDLAKGMASIIEKQATGIYHLSGEEILTPYQMGCAIGIFLKLDTSLIQPVTADNFSQPAKRPLRTPLSIDKAKNHLDYHPVSFEEGLRNTFG